MTELQATAGSATDQLQTALTRNEDLQTSITEALSNTDDTNIAATSIAYANEQAAYEAALRAGATIVQESLLELPPVDERQGDAHMSVTFQSIRFGTVEIQPEDVIEFPFGLIGLGGVRYALIDRNPGTGFLWLHAVDDPALALPVVSPTSSSRVLAADRGRGSRAHRDSRTLRERNCT